MTHTRPIDYDKALPSDNHIVNNVITPPNHFATFTYILYELSY